MITAAQAMVAFLEQQEVRILFGLPGAAICPFYDALSGSSIRHILVRQEQNAVHAASGYARMTHRPAVCAATSGPGALNLITGIATAYMDSVPLVILTGQVNSELLGRDVFQEADITGAAEPFVKHSYLVKDAKSIVRILEEAFYIAGSGRPGPVLLDIPVDVQQTLIDYKPSRTAVRIPGYKPSSKGHSGQEKRAADAIRNARKPLICAGGGIFYAGESGAQAELKRFSERLNIPVVTTMMGLGVVRSDDPCNLGMIGMYGTAAANRAMNQADLILMIGARVGDRAIRSPIALSEKATIIHVDIDPAEIGKNLATDIPIVGDAKHILLELSEFLRGALPHADWTAQLRQDHGREREVQADRSALDPRAVIAAISKLAPANTVLCADVGQNQIWSATAFSIQEGRFLASGGMGTMGYSIPAAIGAKLASPQSMVLAVCGDGSFQMQMMELATVCAQGLPIKMVLMNNHRLGMVRELQQKWYQGRETAVDLCGSPDFAAIAGAYGIKARRLSLAQEIPAAAKELLEWEGSYLLECEISPEEPTAEGSGLE